MGIRTAVEMKRDEKLTTFVFVPYFVNALSVKKTHLLFKSIHGKRWVYKPLLA